MAMWTESSMSSFLDSESDSAHSDHMVLPRGPQPVQHRLRSSWRVLSVVALAMGSALVAALFTGGAVGGAADDTHLVSRDTHLMIQKSLKNDLEEMAGDAVDETKEAVGNMEEGFDEFLKKHGGAINKTVESAEEELVEVIETELAKNSNETLKSVVEGAQEAVDSILDETQNVLAELESTTDAEGSTTEAEAMTSSPES